MDDLSASELLDVIVRNKLEHLNLKGQIERMEQVPALGASCDVFVGHLRVGDRQVKVAVKKLRIFCNKEGVIVKRLAKEVYIWSRLKHRGVLPLLGFFLDSDGPFPHLVSEFMARGTLFDYLRTLEHGMNTIIMAEGIADGVSYLHRKDVVHADLKSQNILISESGRPLITDFGVSHIMSATMTAMCGTTAVSSKGTVRWTAIELFATDNPMAAPSKESDVWAFGMVLYELLTRKLPYYNLRSDLQVITTIARGQFPEYPSSRVAIGSRRLWDICQKCWTKNPQDRPTINVIHRDIQTSFPRVLVDVNAVNLAIERLRCSELGAAVNETLSRTPSRPREDQDPYFDTSPFPSVLAPLILAKLAKEKSIDDLRETGGINGVMKGLGVRRSRGIDDVVELGCTQKKMFGFKGMEVRNEGDEDLDDDPCVPWPFPASVTLADRQRVYGRNVLPSRTSKTLLQLIWFALKDKVPILLAIAATISLALGLHQYFKGSALDGQVSCDDNGTCKDPPMNWVEGIAIMVALVAVVCVGTLSDWQKERHLRMLNKRKEDRTVKVVRAGSEWMINVEDVVVGDIALVEPGEIVPCDGIFLEGHNVRCDESILTGEFVAIKKLPYDLVDHALRSGNPLPAHADCFIVSGSRVCEGIGSYIVTAVGPRSSYGELIALLRREEEETPPPAKLKRIWNLITELGGLAGVFYVIALLSRYFVNPGTIDSVQTAYQNKFGDYWRSIKP